jgi:non-ribosomal peptide synthetase component E (peptide arylation enzyme)
MAVAAAGTLATAAYLNAKYHIAHDLSLARIAGDSPATIAHITKCVAEKRVTIYHILQSQSIHRPSDVLLVFEGREYTYKEIFDAVVRCGNWLMNDLGIQKGEVVALDGGNSVEYILLWYGLEGIGAVPSFVNNNLTGKGLLHCIEVRRPIPKTPDWH